MLLICVLKCALSTKASAAFDQGIVVPSNGYHSGVMTIRKNVARSICVRALNLCQLIGDDK